MKKRYIIIAAAVILGAVGVFLYGRNPQSAKIIVATDTHYLSRRINDKGNAFWKTVTNADGKTVQYCDEIITAFGEEVVNSGADVLILSGDLTFNGEKESHEDFVQKLYAIQSKGVQVLTIPGNHDLYSTGACGFSSDGYYRVSGIDAAAYEDMYADFGLSRAESRDENSFSYLYKVNKDLYILMIDTNAYTQNSVSEKTYRWIERQLKKISQKNARVIAVTHQNLLAHNEEYYYGFQLFDADELSELFQKYGVKCNLSGHIHMQHTKTDGIAEIVTSSLLVSPVQYGVIDFDGDINYRAKSVDVSAWAKANGLDDENLLNFAEYAENFFRTSSYNKALKMLGNYDVPDRDKPLIAEAFSVLNTAYFAGRSTDKAQIEKGIELGKRCGGFLGMYMKMMSREAAVEHTRMTIQ